MWCVLTVVAVKFGWIFSVSFTLPEELNLNPGVHSVRSSDQVLSVGVHCVVFCPSVLEEEIFRYLSIRGE